jgi:hypothetical protein
MTNAQGQNTMNVQFPLRKQRLSPKGVPVVKVCADDPVERKVKLANQ